MIVCNNYISIDEGSIAASGNGKSYSQDMSYRLLSTLTVSVPSVKVRGIEKISFLEIQYIAEKTSLYRLFGTLYSIPIKSGLLQWGGLLSIASE